ncbi:hypothetical protein [Nocardioides sp. W7]|uniref:hypothetical protein n=1 Tax=Nocardioides sp. W7 TaxID=2931390 RepID=UPI001FD33F9D|nr:hypothetical protein [Nocardioides sp. W7]
MALTPLTTAQQDALDVLETSGRIQKVPSDLSRASDFLRQADDALLDVPNLTKTHNKYNLAYDAAHDAGEAMLAAYGYRTRSGPGQHEALGRFLAVVFDKPPASGAAQHYEQMRRDRNRNRYEARPVTWPQWCRPNALRRSSCRRPSGASSGRGRRLADRRDGPSGGTSYDLATTTHDGHPAGQAGRVTIPAQPPYSPQQPPPPPTGWVALTVQGSWMTNSLIPPKVWMNGHPVPVRYGDNPVPVHPGRLRIDVRCTWLREYGQATIDIDVAPGQTVPVFYAAPLHQFSRGRIGPERQKRPGVLALVVTLSVVVAVIVALVVAAAGLG